MIPKENAAEMQKAVDGDVQAAYRSLLKADNIHCIVDGVELLKKTTGVEPSFANEYAERVQKAYKTYFKERKYTGMNDIRKKTRIRPELDRTEVKAVYEGLIKKEEFEELAEIRRICSIRPDKKTMNDYYGGLLQSIKSEKIGTIMFMRMAKRLGEAAKATGVKPEFAPVQEKFVQKIIEALIASEEEEYAEELWKRAGLVPSEKTMRNARNALLESGPDYHEFSEGHAQWYGTFSALQWLKEKGCGITDEEAQGFYRKYFKKSDIGAAEGLKKLYGMGPKLSEEEVQATYRKILNTDKFSSMKEVKKLTGISPKFDLTDVREACERRIASGHVNQAVLLREITGLEPKVGWETLAKGVDMMHWVIPGVYGGDLITQYRFYKDMSLFVDTKEAEAAITMFEKEGKDREANAIKTLVHVWSK